MKKIILTIATSSAIIAILLNFSAIFALGLPTVDLIQMEKTVYSPKIYASGKIEESSRSEISYQIPIVTKEVFVDVGDQVKAGDIIAKVDVEKTKQAVLNLLKLTDFLPNSYVEYLSEIDLDIDALNSAIPMNITANFTGVISDLNALCGSIIAPNQAVATISNLDELRAKIAVPESYADKVCVGQDVSLYVEAVGKSYDGKIATIFPSAHEELVGTSTETVVNIYAKIPTYDSSLKSGYSVFGEIKTQAPQFVDTIPYEAINQDENNKEFVYVVENSMAVKRYITTATEFENCVEVVNGISSSDFVIKNNKDITKENQYVKFNVN